MQSIHEALLELSYEDLLELACRPYRLSSVRSDSLKNFESEFLSEDIAVAEPEVYKILFNGGFCISPRKGIFEIF